MRARNLKPGFFKNEELAELPPLVRILFEGLWCYADRDGRFEWRPQRIKAEILPYDKCDIERFLMSLHVKTFIYKYSINGKDYGFVPTFLEHQNPHLHEAKSKIPPPPEDIINKIQQNQCPDMSNTNTIHVSDIHQKSTRQALLNPSSLNPSALKRSITTSSNTTKKRSENSLLKKDDFEREKTVFLKNKDHLQNQCEILMNTFKNKENGKDFDPLKFIVASIKSKIPVEVYKKVLDSMVKQRDKIKNPEAWVIAVLKKEQRGYYYIEALKEHYKLKREDVEPLNKFLKEGEEKLNDNG